jgi:energy-coupling factor transporter ATP-binding protein EcfA2
MIKINKIQLNNFRFFIDDEEHNSFELNAQNMLVYGENGSGKSSLFKAFEFLAQKSIPLEKFNENINIFKNDNTYIEFEFDSDNPSLRIDSDELSLVNHEPFTRTVSVSKPMMDYKSLLKIHYRTNVSSSEINIFELFAKLLVDYPVEENIRLQKLRGQRYFNTLENIIKNELFEYINIFLGYFEQSFKIEDISFDAFEREIILKIEYFNKKIENYHNFLNEARLSSLAISIYFAIIKKQFSYLGEDSLKILVLDDLLISLDMNNRLNLINILKTEFSDFQIFFFTHDKSFFEILKEKMSWKAFEVYVDNNGEFEKPHIKKSLNYFESAKKHFDEYDYPACANYLRKEVERIKKIVNQSDIDGIPVNRSMQIVKRLVNSNDFINFSRPDTTDEACIGSIRGKLIGIKNNLDNAREPFVEISMQEINSVLHRILHPQSHDDTSRPLYKKELEDAIKSIRKLREGI